MDEILKVIIDIKSKIEDVKNKQNSLLDKSSLCKILVMLNIAEMLIRSNSNINDNDKHYFEGQAFVGRYFCDWGLDWIADDYLKISSFIKDNYWD